MVALKFDMKIYLNFSLFLSQNYFLEIFFIKYFYDFSVFIIFDFFFVDLPIKHITHRHNGKAMNPSEKVLILKLEIVYTVGSSSSVCVF